MYYVQALMDDQSHDCWIALNNDDQPIMVTDIQDATPFDESGIAAIVGQLLRAWNPVEIRIVVG